ncbi:hypothetical protein GF327_09165 [Candidatus Woesearchaeota archaeon]|nr:hypothetical protein [Candidatus Woesearchaeota archaeon]
MAENLFFIMGLHEAQDGDIRPTLSLNQGNLIAIKDAIINIAQINENEELTDEQKKEQLKEISESVGKAQEELIMSLPGFHIIAMRPVIGEQVMRLPIKDEIYQAAQNAPYLRIYAITFDELNNQGNQASAWTVEGIPIQEDVEDLKREAQRRYRELQRGDEKENDEKPDQEPLPKAEATDPPEIQITKVLPAGEGKYYVEFEVNENVLLLTLAPQMQEEISRELLENVLSMQYQQFNQIPEMKEKFFDDDGKLNLIFIQQQQPVPFGQIQFFGAGNNNLGNMPANMHIALRTFKGEKNADDFVAHLHPEQVDSWTIHSENLQQRANAAIEAAEEHILNDEKDIYDILTELRDYIKGREVPEEEGEETTQQPIQSELELVKKLDKEITEVIQVCEEVISGTRAEETFRIQAFLNELRERLKGAHDGMEVPLDELETIEENGQQEQKKIRDIFADKIGEDCQKLLDIKNKEEADIEKINLAENMDEQFRQQLISALKSRNEFIQSLIDYVGQYFARHRNLIGFVKNSSWNEKIDSIIDEIHGNINEETNPQDPEGPYQRIQELINRLKSLKQAKILPLKKSMEQLVQSIDQYLQYTRQIHAGLEAELSKVGNQETTETIETTE